MEEVLCQELLAKTQQALDADDWDAVVRIWQPWVDQGDAEAEYQLACHYLSYSPCEDDATHDAMNELIERAAAKDHPDAVWFLTTRRTHSPEANPEYVRQLLRAGELGSGGAQRELGVNYATGDWPGPKDLAEAARWYRLAAQNGEAESQYDLGFMLLLGEGEPKNTEEGLMWLERAGEHGEYKAFRLLVDCYEDGYCDVPVDGAKAQEWRTRLEEYKRLNPPSPSRRYFANDIISHPSLKCLLDIKGVTGNGLMPGGREFSVYYDAAVITEEQLDEMIRATGLAASPIE